MSLVYVYNNKVLGRIKPVHSMVGVPSISVRSEKKWNRNYFAHVTELGMPYSRFNGVAGLYGSMTFVDVSNIFRNFDADEFDAKNYDFTFTDWLVEECISRGVKPIYRLGVCKEPDHWLKAYNIFPPKDYAKFTRICERIILHYNSGWNGGYNADIKYWEIWDGPDNAREIKDNACWKGTKQEYFEFYRFVSTTLKNRFPHLMFGGYGASGFNLNDENDYSKEFFNDFISYVTDEKTKAPLDFFTWNSISNNPKENNNVSNFIREKLDEFGLTDCENICGSWNSGVLDPSEIKSASSIGANLIAWQNSSVSKATYDNCTMGAPYGIFALRINAQTIPSYGYYAIKAFNALYKLGFQIETTTDDQEISVLAAASFDKVKLLIVNNSEYAKDVEIRTFDVKRNRSMVSVIKEVDTSNLSIEEMNNIVVSKKVTSALKFNMLPNEVRLYEFE